VRSRSPRFGALAAALLLLSSCSSRREGALPTYEEYSDGTSVFAERLLAGWKAGDVPAELVAPALDWSGPFPGDGLVPVASRPPLSIAIFRVGAPPPSVSGQSRAEANADAFRRSLATLREPFASLGRTEATIFQFRKRGEKREILLGLFLSGADRSGGLRQTGGKIRMTLAPAGAQKNAWRMESGRVESWLAASTTEPLFENVAVRAGLARPHHAFLPNAAKNIPIPGEHMPPGAAVLDFDRDGRQDLFVPSGDGNRLYRNRGDGTFEDVAKAAGVAGQEGEGVGALAFDYDNDGDTDIYETYLLRPNLLYRNRGDGTFEEVAQAAGVDLNDYSTSSAALDYDRDGDADLYVLVYGHPGHGPTLEADNAPPNHLYRNEGNGKFTDVSKATHTDDRRWGLALQSADLDGDLWPDIYVANDFGDHTYFHNRGDGTFENASKKAGVLDPAFGMGVTVDDYDGDGLLDFFVSNYSFPLSWFLRDPRYPMPPFPYSLGRPLVWRRLTKLSRGSSLFRNLGGDRFTDMSEEADVWDTSWSWGCVFVDADLDGRADLFVVNGMVTGKNEAEHEIDFWNLMSVEFRNFEKGIPIAEFGDDSLWGRLPKRFYRNRDGRHFDELAAATGLESIGNQRGLVVLDADGDGAPDLFASGFLQPNALWINRNPSRAKTLVVSLEGDPTAPGPHRSTLEALGAAVTVEAGGLSRTQVVSAGYSFLSSGPRELYFGLGDAEKADRVIVKWPSGRVSERREAPAGRLAIRESP